MYLTKRNQFFKTDRFYYLTGGCVVIVTLLLTSTKVSQVNNMSKSQCCPLYGVYYYLTGVYYYLTGGCVIIVGVLLSNRGVCLII